jgi:hypothetical protein
MVVKSVESTSQFLSIIERDISSEFFFNCLLSDKDLSKLLSTCRGMKVVVLKWKNVFPIKQIRMKSRMTNKMLVDFVNHYSSKIIKLIVTNGDGLIDFITSLLHSNLLELDITSCSGEKLPILSYSLSNLTSLAISISSVTKDVELKGFSKMISMKSITINQVHGLSGLGLEYLLAKKELLTQLTIDSCRQIPSDGFHCLTILTNLTKLTAHRTKIDNFGLKTILLHCFLKYLEISDDEGKVYNNITFFNQTNLQHLCLNVDDLGLESLSNNSVLTSLKLDIIGISNRTHFYSYLSSLCNLEHLFLMGKDRFGYDLTNERLSILSSLVRLSQLTLIEFRLSIRNLFHLSSVVFLTIQDCIIFPDDVNAEYPFLENLKHLSLINISNDDDDELLFQLPKKLTHLTIDQNDGGYPDLDRRMLENFSSLLYLTHYTFKHSDYILHGLSYLCSLSNLDYLCLTETLRDKDLLCLSSLSNLTHIKLGGNSTISNIGLSHLSSLQKLIYLDLGELSLISDDGLSCLSSHTKLTYLALGRNSLITDKGISYISSCVNLTDLFLGSDSRISYQGISKLTSLKVLSNISSIFSYEPLYDDIEIE